MSHLRRAAIYERLHDAERAAWHYGEFVRLWGDGDVELQPYVGRARAAMARLSAHRAASTTP